MTSLPPQTSRFLLRSGAALIALTGHHANAQDQREGSVILAATPPAPAPAEGGEIVVTGIRAGLDRALEIKRDAPSIVDVISAEDIGRFPDVNVAESVQRISGVQINRTRGEGRSVNIRGLPDTFTLVTLNGRTVPNALNDLFAGFSRSFDLSALPSEFVNTLEVYKSPTADMDEGGLSGTVNIRTPHALDLGRRVLALSAQGTYETNSGEISPRVSGLYADTFADDTLGVTLGLSYNQRRPQTQQVETGYATVSERNGVPNGGGADDLDGNGVIEPNKTVRIPGLIIHDFFAEDNRRLSALASVQWQATDRLQVYADGYWTRQDVEAVRQENYNSFSNSGGVVSSITELIDGVPTATDFTVSNLDLRNGGRYQDRRGHITSLVGGAEWEEEGWRIVAEGSLQRSHQRRDTLNIADTFPGTARFTAQPGDTLPSVTYLDGYDATKLDPANFRLLSLNGELNRQTRDRLWDMKLDATHDFDGGVLTALRAGVKYTDRTVYQDNRQLTISAANVSRLYGGLPAGPLPGSFSAAPFMQLVKSASGSFLGSYDGEAIFPTGWLSSTAKEFASRFSTDELIAAGTYTNDATGILDLEEQTLAFYGRGDFAAANLSGNFGLRAVKTSQTSRGVSPNLNGITVEVETGNFTRVPAAEPLTVQRSYWDWLPSANLKWEVTPELQLRLAASRTITRPNLGDINPTTTANGNALTVTRNNPYLDPFRANNVDATIEYYYARDAVVGASLFYKNLESLVARQFSVQSLPVTYVRTTGNTTVQTDFIASELVNGEGVDLKGIELYWQQAFSFLPEPLDGFGAIANYTFIDNSDPEQLTGASKHNYNLIGYYEKGPLAVRLSYSWRSDFLQQAAVQPAMGRETQSYGTLDGSIGIKLTDYATVVVEGVNLTDADEVVQFTTGLPANYLDAGRRIFAGVRLAF